MGQLKYNPLLRTGFQTDNDVSDIKFVNPDGSEISISELLTNLINDIDSKVDIFQGEGNENKVVITNAQGEITTISGVVMSESERKKLALLTNSMILKGVKASEEQVKLTPNPEIGWVFFVPTAGGNNYVQYCYCESGWEKIGTTAVSGRYVNPNPSTIAVGGIKAGTTFDMTYDEIFDKMFYPPKEMSGFSLSTNINTNTIYEKGKELIITQVTRKVTIGSYPIVDFNVWTSKAKTTYIGGGANTAKITDLEYNGNTLYGEIKDSSGKTLTIEYTPTFKLPYFHGVCPKSELPIDSVIINSNKELTQYENKTYSVALTEENPYCWFAVPKAAGSISEILDGNGYKELTGDIPDFKKIERKIDTLYLKGVDYYFFVKLTPADGNYNYTLTK